MMAECSVCGDEITGDVMLPETGDGPMHPDCWVSWVVDQPEGGDER